MTRAKKIKSDGLEALLSAHSTIQAVIGRVATVPAAEMHEQQAQILSDLICVRRELSDAFQLLRDSTLEVDPNDPAGKKPA